MADLRIHGNWGGPGEEVTARFLEENLPRGWVIDANVYLPTEDHADVDLVVTGKNRIFIVENKHWGPIVLLDDRVWEVRSAKGKKYDPRSPMPNLAQKTRQSLQIIQNAVPAGATILKQRPVDRLLILSYPELSLHGHIKDLDRVVLMKDAAVRLQELDAEKNTDLASYRSDIVHAIAGLPARPDDVTELGDYLIVEKLEQVGLARRFSAEHKYGGESVVLYCYGAADSEDELRHQERESEAINTLEGLQRTWKTYASFVEPRWGWFIRPQVRPDGAKSLSQLSVTEALRDFGPDPLRSLVEESFEALAQIHASGVVHRALSPSRVWIGRSKRVLFSDFFHARIDDKKTLIPIPVDKGAAAFAAPENAEDSHAATEASDVFSLGSIFLQWIRTEASADGLDALEAELELVEVLEACTAKERGSRPSAIEVAHSLRPRPENSADVGTGAADDSPSSFSLPSQTDEFEVGNLVGRFKLEEALGEGGAATSWRAYDTTEERMVVVRRLKRSSEFERLRGNPPFKNINNRFCQGHINLEAKPDPGLHIVNFIEGQTLEERHALRPFEVDELRTVAHQLFTVLHEAFHKEGVVHGDISARNLLVNDDLEVFFIDLASVVEIGDPPPSATPRYKAPELRVEGGLTSAQSDIYSAGAVLIDLMLNRPPYVGTPTSDEAGKVVRKLTDDEKAIWGRDGEVLLKVLFASVNPDPTMRPARSDEFARTIKLRRATDPKLLPEVNASENINETVDQLRQLFVDSEIGNRGMLAFGGPFAEETYVETKLDLEMLPKFLAGEYKLVLITGNPGDGKTTFLNALRGEVETRGGTTLEENQSRWSGVLGDMSFTAVMDASESFETSSSDQVLREAMAPKGGSQKHVTLVAMNDGRLRQFVDDFEDEVDGLRAASEDVAPLGESSIVIVDLKSRALVSERHDGLGLQALDSLVRPELWEERGCGGCAAKGVCPILRNVKFLRSEGRPGIQRLTLMSHLSSQRRATLRDFRSAISYTVTKDMGCQDIHAARASEDLIAGDPSSAAWNTVFDAESRDKLLSDWRRFDPANSVSPAFLREAMEQAPESGAERIDVSDVASLSRRRFMGESMSDESLAESLGHYRHLLPFMRFVMDRVDGEAVKTRILEGLSKLSGVYLDNQDGLRVASYRVDPTWTLIKAVDADSFLLRLDSNTNPVVEFFPDSAVLVHEELGVELRISLDMAELLLRAADGELFGDDDSLALRQQALAFLERVSQSQGGRATLLSPSGDQFRIEAKNGRIEMVGGQ
ncbi:NERD domain-containing protein [Pontimonas sp.]|nr:NERD domain-containing protein [Pontimonas sp.]